METHSILTCRVAHKVGKWPAAVGRGGQLATLAVSKRKNYNYGGETQSIVG